MGEATHGLEEAGIQQRPQKAATFVSLDCSMNSRLTSLTPASWFVFG